MYCLWVVAVLDQGEKHKFCLVEDFSYWGDLMVDVVPVRFANWGLKGELYNSVVGLVSG